MYKLILAASIAAFLFSAESFSMRCGTQLINGGDYAYRALDICGEPAFNNGSTLVYEQADGMVYTLHVNSSNIIDNIDFRRK